MMRTALVRIMDGILGGAAIAVTGCKGGEMKRIFFAFLILAMAQTVSAQEWAKEKLAKSPRLPNGACSSGTARLRGSWGGT